MKYELMRAHLNEARRATAAPEDAALDLFGLARTLWRGKLWILLAAIALGALGWSYATHLAVPRYTAQATVALENRQASVIDLQNVVSGLSGDQATINTEVEVLRSRSLVGQLVDELGLLADPEFNPFLAPDAPAATTRRSRDATINRVLEAVSITNLRSSYVFTITATTTDAEKSARLANTLGEIYIADQLRVKAAAMETATAWLTDRVETLKSELQAAESEVQRFSATTDLISAEALDMLNRQIKDTRDRVIDLRAERDELAARIGRIDSATATGDHAALATLLRDPALTRLAAREPGGSSDGFDTRAAMLADLVRADHARTADQLVSLTGALSNLENSYGRQSADLVTLEQLEREAQALRAIYGHFLTRLQETSVQQGIQQPDSRMLSHAVRPGTPSSPHLWRVTVLTALLGLVLGAGAVLLREMMHTGFRTADELERETGLTVMGQLPKLATRRRKGVVRYLVDKPTSAAAEAVRNLRTSVLMSSVDRPPQVILSTSSVSGEGKTTTAIALAQNFAGLGKSVLLVEGDIRRRVFPEYFEVAQGHGLLSVLSGDARFEAVVQRSALTGVDVLLGEQSDTNAADVFSSERFADFMTEMRSRYDIIIIDTPPVLLVPDSRIIAHVADAVLFTVKWDATSRAQVREAVRQFAMAGIAISGAVLNLIDPRGMKRYGYGGAYGAYAAYGHNKYYNN